MLNIILYLGSSLLTVKCGHMKWSHGLIPGVEVG